MGRVQAGGARERRSASPSLLRREAPGHVNKEEATRYGGARGQDDVAGGRGLGTRADGPGRGRGAHVDGPEPGGQPPASRGQSATPTRKLDHASAHRRLDDAAAVPNVPHSAERESRLGPWAEPARRPASTRLTADRASRSNVLLGADGAAADGAGAARGGWGRLAPDAPDAPFDAVSFHSTSQAMIGHDAKSPPHFLAMMLSPTPLAMTQSLHPTSPTHASP